MNTNLKNFHYQQDYFFLIFKLFHYFSKSDWAPVMDPPGGGGGGG